MAEAKRSKERLDAIWDVLTERFGDARTQSEKRRRGAVVRELYDADATPDEVRRTIGYCERHYPHFTENAMLTNLSQAQREDSPVRRAYDVAERERARLRAIEGGRS